MTPAAIRPTTIIRRGVKPHFIDPSIQLRYMLYRLNGLNPEAGSVVIRLFRVQDVAANQLLGYTGPFATWAQSFRISILRCTIEEPRWPYVDRSRFSASCWALLLL
jgi:hypothetical protein